jgi:hypothetical protein
MERVGAPTAGAPTRPAKPVVRQCGPRHGRSSKSIASVAPTRTLASTRERKPITLVRTQYRSSTDLAVLQAEPIYGGRRSGDSCRLRFRLGALVIASLDPHANR